VVGIQSMALREAGKRFFFEKKKQKTFSCGRMPGPAARHKVAKVFWCFFSKKNTVSLIQKEVITCG
jgi:hypothetical protein